MKCERAIDVLLNEHATAEAAEIDFATEHLRQCEDCQSALTALEMLEDTRTLPIPGPSGGAFERAMQRATHVSHAVGSAPGRFALGMVAGAALAAAASVAVFILLPQTPGPVVEAPPQIVLARDEARPVSISLDSAQALEDAEIHLSLTGQVGLQGFEGQNELRWRTNLDAGANQLTLPLVSLGAGGGQVLVEVRHANGRRVFVFDVAATG